MTKILLFAALLLYINKGMAQFASQGQKVLTAAVAFNTNANDYNQPNQQFRNTNAFLSFEVGKFVKNDKLKSVGISGSYNYSKQSPSGLYKATAAYIGIFYTSTKVYTLGNKFYWGIQQRPEFFYNKNVTNNASSTDKVDRNTMGISYFVSPTFYYQLNKRFVLQLLTREFAGVAASYAKTKYQNFNMPYTDKGYAIGLSGGFWNNPLQHLSIGFNYLLQKK